MTNQPAISSSGNPGHMGKAHAGTQGTRILRTAVEQRGFRLSCTHSTEPIYLYAREGDSRGGVRADHQRHDGGAHRTKHVRKLKETQKQDKTINHPSHKSTM